MTKIIVEDTTRAWGVLRAAAARCHLDLKKDTKATEALLEATGYFLRRVDVDEDIQSLVEVVMPAADEIASWSGNDAHKYLAVFLSLKHLSDGERKPYITVLALIGMVCRHLDPSSTLCGSSVS